MVKEKNINKKWLIAVDLDGTLLNDKGKLPKKNKDVLMNLKKDGHKVSIITGRPLRSSLFVYNELGLDTIMANHNGAIIHNPSDSGFLPIETALNRKLIFEFIENEILKGEIENFAVESKEELFIKKHDKWLEEFFFIGEKLDVVICKDVKDVSSKLNVDPFSMLILLKGKHSSESVSRIILNLKTIYGDTFMLRSWQHPKVKSQMVLEVNPISVNKNTALQIMRSYYNIHDHKTIVFGDGLNDVQMLDGSKYGIVMKNAREEIRFFGNDLTYKDNNDSGVGDYLEKWFYNKNSKK